MDKTTGLKAYTEIVNRITERRPNPNYRDEKGETALMHCAQFGGILYGVIPKTLEINAQRPDGMTALMLAVATQPKDARLVVSTKKDGFEKEFSYRGILVKILLENNADLTLRNQAGETALDIAKQVGNEEILKLFGS
jgi:ankyrin repeat protein